MSAFEPYRPSNGTEGECFMSAWCAKCERDRDHRENDGDACEIATLTMAIRVDDPAYPREWRSDGPSGPRCTAFLAAGDEEPIDDAAVVRRLL